jgi:hypothetical protein
MGEALLPSGLAGTIREITVEEENLLANPKLARTGRNLQRVFEECWTHTTDAGPYEFPDGRLVADQLLQGDSLVLLVLLRIESYGPEYSFDVNCPHCGQRIPWEVDLVEFLRDQTRPMPEESRIILREKGGIFDAVFPRCGKAYKFRLLRGLDERKFPRIRRHNREQLSATLIDISLHEVEGVRFKRAFLGLEPYPKDTPEEDRVIMSSGDANYFRRHSDEVNCGLETTFEVECPDHGEVRVELPFREDFLLPKFEAK